MSQEMIDYPDAVWTRPQQIDKLNKIANLFVSKVFKSSTPFTRQSQAHWLELIRLVSDLVRQSSLTGHRISFTEEVSIQDEARDITSLLDMMRQSAHLVSSVTAAQRDLLFLSPQLNYVAGAGVGQFANGLFFSCPHGDELSFYIGHDRIYFYRHLMRAYLEASRHLASLADSD
jgi:hypothetical protein